MQTLRKRGSRLPIPAPIVIEPMAAASCGRLDAEKSFHRGIPPWRRTIEVLKGASLEVYRLLGIERRENRLQARQDDRRTWGLER